MLLRVARSFPGSHHRTVVAQYRRHQSNASRNGVRMLQTMDEVLRSQRPFVNGNRRLETALRKGERHWRDFFGGVTIKQIGGLLWRGNIPGAVRALGVLLWHVRGRLFVLRWKYRERVISSAGARLASLLTRSHKYRARVERTR